VSLPTSSSAANALSGRTPPGAGRQLARRVDDVQHAPLPLAPNGRGTVQEQRAQGEDVARPCGTRLVLRQRDFEDLRTRQHSAMMATRDGAGTARCPIDRLPHSRAFTRRVQASDVHRLRGTRVPDRDGDQGRAHAAYALLVSRVILTRGCRARARTNATSSRGRPLLVHFPAPIASAESCIAAREHVSAEATRAFGRTVGAEPAYPNQLPNPVKSFWSAGAACIERRVARSASSRVRPRSGDSCELNTGGTGPDQLDQDSQVECMSARRTAFSRIERTDRARR